MVNNVEVVVYDKEGFKDAYLIKPTQATFDRAAYLQSCSLKSNQVFNNTFDSNNNISYGDPLDILMSLE